MSGPRRRRTNAMPAGTQSAILRIASLIQLACVIEQRPTWSELLRFGTAHIAGGPPATVST